MMSSSGGQASGQLSVGAPPPSQPPVAPPVEQQTEDRFQAVINCHDCNLHQIEVAIESNAHTHDPHPTQPGKYLARHPVILACFDNSNRDDQGRPAEGHPSELNMTAIRQVFSARYPHVSPDGPPEDGSHISVDGMHFVAEKDQNGNPTGRVTLGNPED